MNQLTEQQIKDNGAAVEAKLAGKPVQFLRRHDHRSQWDEMGAQRLDFDFYTFYYRPAPTPEPPKPWDFNSRPLSVVWVYKKGFITDSMITTWGDDCVVVATKTGLLRVGYGDLFREWLQRDGLPCGVVKETK